MGIYEQIDSLCRKHNTNITVMCKKAGVSRSALSDYKANRIKSISRENLRKIANFFKVDVALITEEKVPYCCECGLTYLPDYEEDVKIHNEKHSKRERAINKFGFCWPGMVREEAKYFAYEILNDPQKSIEEKTIAAEEILKAYFSRSLEGSGFSLEHVNCDTFIAMLLNQEQFKTRFEEQIYLELVKKYGKKEGIKSGTYYFIEKKKQDIYNDGNKIARITKKLRQLDEAKIEKAESYIDFLISEIE